MRTHPDLTSLARRLGEDEHVAWSVRVASLTDAPTRAEILFDHEPHALLRTASMGKILLLLALARGVDAGDLDPSEPLDRRTVPPVADSGIWQHLDIDVLSLHSAARLVGLASDNWATNALIACLGGVERVTACAADIGIHDVHLHDVVRDVRTHEHPPTLSEASAAGLTSLMAALTGSWHDITPSTGARVRGWLRGGLDLSMVAAPFGLDPLAHSATDRGVDIVNKTGTDAGIRADAGIIDGPERHLVYACVANWRADEVGIDPVRDHVLDTMHDLGRVLRGLVSA